MATFSPTDIPDLLQWYDASQLDLADGTALEHWPDVLLNRKSVAQSDATARPIFSKHKFNGNPCVIFDGVNDWLYLTGQEQYTQSNGTTVIAAFEPTKDAGNQMLVGVSDYRFYHRSPSSNNSGAIMTGASYLQPGATTLMDPHVKTYVHTRGIKLDQFINGALVGTAVTNIGGLSLWAGFIGGFSTGGSYLGAKVGEILIFDRALTDDEVAQVNDYLHNKWLVDVGIFPQSMTLSGSTAISNGIGARKTTNSNAWGNFYARIPDSRFMLEGNDEYIEFSPALLNGYMSLGFREGNYASDNFNYDYEWYFYEGGASVRGLKMPNGSSVATITYDLMDRIGIGLEGGKVCFYKNKQKVYECPTTVTVWPLYFSAHFFTYLQGIDFVQLKPAPGRNFKSEYVDWKDFRNTMLGRAGQLRKTDTGTNALNADAISTKAFEYGRNFLTLESVYTAIGSQNIYFGLRPVLNYAEDNGTYTTWPAGIQVVPSYFRRLLKGATSALSIPGVNSPTKLTLSHGMAYYSYLNRRLQASNAISSSADVSTHLTPGEDVVVDTSFYYPGTQHPGLERMWIIYEVPEQYFNSYDDDIVDIHEASVIEVEQDYSYYKSTPYSEQSNPLSLINGNKSGYKWFMLQRNDLSGAYHPLPTKEFLIDNYNFKEAQVGNNATLDYVWPIFLAGQYDVITTEDMLNIRYQTAPGMMMSLETHRMRVRTSDANTVAVTFIIRNEEVDDWEFTLNGVSQENFRTAIKRYDAETQLRIYHIPFTSFISDLSGQVTRQQLITNRVEYSTVVEDGKLSIAKLEDGTYHTSAFTELAPIILMDDTTTNSLHLDVRAVKPIGTTMSVQYSTNGDSGPWRVVPTNGNLIIPDEVVDNAVFMRVMMTSDGTATPVLEGITQTIKYTSNDPGKYARFGWRNEEPVNSEGKLYLRDFSIEYLQPAEFGWSFSKVSDYDGVFRDRNNLVGPEGNFEYDTNNDGLADEWIKYNGAAKVHSISNEARYGIASQRMTKTGENDYIIRRHIGIQKDKHYVVIFDMKRLTEVSGGWNIYIADPSTATNLKAITGSAMVGNPTEDFIPVVRTFTAHVDDASIWIGGGTAGSGDALIDGVRIYEITAEEMAKIGTAWTYKHTSEIFPYRDSSDGYEKPKLTLSLLHDYRSLAVAFNPEAIAKDFTIRLFKDGQEVFSRTVTGNTKAIYTEAFTRLIAADSIEFEAHSTTTPGTNVVLTELWDGYVTERSDTLKIGAVDSSVGIFVPIDRVSRDNINFKIRETSNVGVVRISTDTARILANDVRQDLRNIYTQMDKSFRQIFGRIEVTFSDPFVDATIESFSTGTAHGTSTKATADDVHVTPYKWFGLADNKLDGTYHPMPVGQKNQTVGWWSDRASDDNGVFAEPVKLWYTFQGRPIYYLRVVGDTFTNEFPVDFDVTLYGEDDEILLQEQVRGNSQVYWEKALEPVVLLVKRMELSIFKINSPRNPAKVAEFFTSFKEIYEAEELEYFNILEEQIFDDLSLPIGNISSNEIDLSLLNMNRKFDPSNKQSPLYGLLKKNRKIRAWLGAEVVPGEIEWSPMGTYWSQDWSTPESAITAVTSGLDRLELIRNTDYTTSPVFIDTDLYTIAEIVLQDAGVMPDEYIIDESWKDIAPKYVWFERIKHREALRILAVEALGRVYCDRMGRIVCGTHVTNRPAVYEYDFDTNIIDHDRPLAWSQIKNDIEVSYVPRKLDARQPVYESDAVVTLQPGQEVSETWYFDKFPCLDAEHPVFDAGGSIEIVDYAVYAWGCEVTYKNKSLYRVTINKTTVYGKPIIGESTRIVRASDNQSILENGKITHQHECPFNQDVGIASTIANTLLATYKDPRHDLSMETRGNVAVELGSKVIAPDGTDEKAEFFIVRQDFRWQGYLETSVKAQKIGGE